MIIFFNLLLILSSLSFAAKKCAEKKVVMYVRGDSMKGLFKQEDEITVDMEYYKCHAPKRSDIVVVNKKGFPAPIIKNLFVLPGDHFELKGNEKDGAELLVNKKPLENGLGQIFRFKDNAYKMLKIYQDQFKGHMPEKNYFIFGTKGNGSRDSSKFGPVQLEEISGKVLTPKKH